MFIQQTWQFYKTGCSTHPLVLSSCFKSSQTPFSSCPQGKGLVSISLTFRIAHFCLKLPQRKSVPKHDRNWQQMESVKPYDAIPSTEWGVRANIREMLDQANMLPVNVRFGLAKHRAATQKVSCHEWWDTQSDQWWIISITNTAAI